MTSYWNRKWARGGSGDRVSTRRGEVSPVSGCVQRARKGLADSRFHCDGPPLCRSKFGPSNRCRPVMDLPVIDPSLVVPRPPICGGQSLFKAQHMWDYRKAAENHGLWWNAYEYLGGWALYDGRLEKSWIYMRNQRDPDAPRSIVPVFSDGLFGATRP